MQTGLFEKKMTRKKTENPRVLLLGASGRVGRMVLHHWRQTSAGLACVPQFRAAGTPGSLVWDPLLGPEPLLDMADALGGFAAMVMLAGVTPGSDKPLALNTLLAEASLRAAAKAGIPRVLLASSSAVYGAGDGAPLAESSPCNPINDYGIAKLEMERACAPWREGGLDLCCLRIGNVAGADALLLNIARAARQEAIEIDIFDDGRGPVRSYIGAQTMASVLQSLCLHSGTLPAALNLAAPNPVSMDALADAAGQPWRGRTPAGPAPQSITLDCTALSKLHDFNPKDSAPEELVLQWRKTGAP